MQNKSRPQWVMGISTRTTFVDKRYVEDLGKLWSRFFSHPGMSLVPHRIDSSIIAVYTDYEHEDKGEYTTVLGFPVTHVDAIPAGLVAVQIPEQTFRSFPVGSTDVQAVHAAWQSIWAMPRTELPRNFVLDYDRFTDQNVTLNVGILA